MWGIIFSHCVNLKLSTPIPCPVLDRDDIVPLNLVFFCMTAANAEVSMMMMQKLQSIEHPISNIKLLSLIQFWANLNHSVKERNNNKIEI